MRRPFHAADDDDDENDGEGRISSTDAACNVWSWVVCAGIVAAAAWIRFFSGSGLPCVPREKLAELEVGVYAALETSLTRFRSQNAALAAENSKLKLQLEQRRQLRASMSMCEIVGPLLRHVSSLSRRKTAMH